MDRNKFVKSTRRELKEIEYQLALVENMKQSITCRKAELESELEAVGASAPARKGNKKVSVAMSLAVRADLTKGIKPYQQSL